MKIVALLLATFAATAAAQLPPHLTESRYCGPPPRDPKGAIIRDWRVTARFKQYHPCPVTGKTSGACPKWYMDHVVSMACGGCDSVSNMQWLPESMWRAKSLWEREVYPAFPPIAGTESACTFQLQ